MKLLQGEWGKLKHFPETRNLQFVAVVSRLNEMCGFNTDICTDATSAIGWCGGNSYDYNSDAAAVGMGLKPAAVIAARKDL